MNKTVFILLLLIGLSKAQIDSGFVKFEADESWIIEINDSLKIQSGEKIKLSSGKFTFKARPKISYNWPVILIEDTIEISHADTLIYALASTNSTAKSMALNPQPKTTTYSENGYQPSNRKHSTLKTGLIISAITTTWLSFYLKREADNYHKSYRRASNLSKINDFYDKSKQFDTFSNIALGLSTAALSSYIYLTLSE